MATDTPVILAFDTSGPYCATAVISGSALLCAKHEEMTKGQAERLMDLITETLAEAGIDFADLDAIGVGVGPGNFTGIRIAVSAARGLALGLQVPAVGISTFEALHFGSEGPCTCLVDARRGEIYAQIFDESGASQPPQIGRLEELQALPKPFIGMEAQQPAYSIAEAIARLAATRDLKNQTRPAPLYLRPADAAPARDPGPTILP